MTASVAAELATRPGLRRAFLESLSPAARAHLLYEWRFGARPMQLPPAGPWRVWFIQAGRGAGTGPAGTATARKADAA